MSSELEKLQQENHELRCENLILKGDLEWANEKLSYLSGDIDCLVRAAEVRGASVAVMALLSALGLILLVREIFS